MTGIATIVLVGAGLSGATADLYCGATNVEVVDGAITLARLWEAAFEEGFEDGLDGWSTQNYETKLAIGIDENGETGSCVLVTNHGAEGDTAFELASLPIPATGGAQFRFSFAWRANRSLSRLAGHKGQYMTQLQWRDEAGEAVDPLPFAFGEASEDWQSMRLEGTIPENAASLIVRLGCDHPNIEANRFLAIDSLRLEVRTEPASYQPTGSVVSRPLGVPADGRRLSWEADVPAGTTLRLQVASAPEEPSGPGQWSPALGPDGTEQSYFTEPADLPAVHQGRPWLRYVASLATDEPAKAPVLKTVHIDDVTDGPWSGLDTEPPAVSERSPTRTADAQPPIGFRLSDETSIDPASLHVWLDGTEITDQVAFRDDRYTYMPPQPLQPELAIAHMGRWRTNNYQRALTIQPVTRTEGSPPGLHITRPVERVDTAFRLESPLIPVEPGADYQLSYWSRHSLDLQGAMNREGTFSGGVAWLAEDGTPVGERAQIDLGPANPDWHRDALQLTAPAGAANAQIAFGFDWPDIFDGTFVDIAEVALDGPHPVRDQQTPNLHRVTVRAADYAGNVLERDWYILIRPPRTQGIVTVRDDGMTLIDGQPFFPIGLYAVWKKPFNDDSFDKAFADLKATGFNLAHTYNSTRGGDFREFYAAAERHGIRLYVASNAGANCTDVETVLWDVAREEGQPALLAWYLADDTASHVSHEDLRAVTEAVRDIDPAHITVQADGVGSPPESRYAKYVDSTDGFLPELYPIHDDSDRGVPRIIADMKTVDADLAAAGTRQKTIWAIVQYFQGWGWPRYPTKEELWAMSYLSIIHGAHGITWYTYGGWGDNHGVTDSPEQWENICRLAGELSQLQEVLVERTGPQPPPPVIVNGPEEDALGYPSISVLLKDHDGKSYLLAANSARADVSVRLPVAGGQTIDLPFENRRIVADETGFEDAFGPYGVHVYVW